MVKNINQFYLTTKTIMEERITIVAVIAISFILGILFEKYFQSIPSTGFPKFDNPPPPPSKMKTEKPICNIHRNAVEPPPPARKQTPPEFPPDRVTKHQEG